MDKAERDKQCRYFWDSTLSVMNGPRYLFYPDGSRDLLKSYVQDIEADPFDKLTLKFGDGEKKTYQMYGTAWKRSLDYLLFRYLTLVLHDTKYSAEIKVPVDVRSTYKAYKLPSKKRQFKDEDFILPDYYSKNHEGKTYSDDSDGLYECFKTNNPVAPAILNVFCHGLYPHAGKTSVRWDPHENAKLYTLEDCGDDTIPAFNPEDYIAYELMTGVSLATEIMAALLELDKEIRELAFDNLCNFGLRELVRLPFPYARASAVRNYLLQINLDWNKSRYHWGTIPSREWTERTVELSAAGAYVYIQALYESALDPEIPSISLPKEYARDDEYLLDCLDYMAKCEKDRTLPLHYIIYGNLQTDDIVKLATYKQPRYRISFPHTDDPAVIEAYKEQIKANLRAVSATGDCVKLLDPNPKCLAVFTNPSHRYIPQLKKYVETGEMNWRGIHPLPLKGEACKVLFRRVFHRVRLASIEAYKDIYQVKHFLPRK